MDRLEWAKHYKRECGRKDKEIKRLRKLVENAYTEGYCDAMSGHLAGMTEGWNESGAQQALKEQ